jgi:hypothetical protein
VCVRERQKETARDREGERADRQIEKQRQGEKEGIW